MKKALGVVLSFAVVFNFAGLTVWAEEKPAGMEATGKKVESKAKESINKQEGLERAIKAAKAKFAIPVEYTEFNSDVNSTGNSTNWNLRWSTKRDNLSPAGGSVEVTVDDRGNILNYNIYKYSRDTEYRKRLPKISKAQAEEAARKFIYCISPELVDQLIFDGVQDKAVIEYDGSYRFTFYRQHNKIPFYQNQISVAINGESGEIIRYSRNWTEDAQFPDTTNIMDTKKAEAAYKEKIGLVLRYRQTIGEAGKATYLEYSPWSTDINAAIDAVTGEYVLNGNRYDIPYYNRMYSYDSYGMLAGSSEGVQLSEQEADEVKRMEALQPVDEIEKNLRGMEELGITEAYQLNRYSIYRNAGSQFLLRMDFSRPLTKESLDREIPEEKLKVMIAAGEMGQNVTVTVNAKTGELVSLNAYGPYNPYGARNELSAEKRSELQKVAENFLRKHKAQKFSQMELQEPKGQNDPYAEKYAFPGANQSTGFAYIRLVNAIPFENHGITLNFDAASGKIVNYNEAWDDIEFMPVEGVIGLEQAYKILFERNGLQLAYIMTASGGEKVAAGTKATAAQEIRLAYSLDRVKPANVDARNGVLINAYNAEPYQAEGSPLTDGLENHYAAEQIKALAAIGVLQGQSDFKPDTPILQKDFLLMLASVRGNNPVGRATGEMKQKELDGFYRMIISEGILDENERNPDHRVTREEAAKYFLKYMGYKKFAEMEGIFNYPFKDKDQLNPKLVGYVTIAHSLGLVPGNEGSFNPRSEVTKAEAAVMIYNYLKR